MSDDKSKDKPLPNPPLIKGGSKDETKIPLAPPEQRLKSKTFEAKGEALQQTPTEPSEEGPYPGLRPYREDEKGKFFGRDADTEILIDKVLTNRLTLLFAASGVGKSSLLQAAVIPHLKSSTGENLAVVYHIDWVSDPVRSVGDAVLAGLRSAELLPDDVGDEERGETLADLLAFCGVFVRPPLVLILDQFEEFFRYQRHQESFRPFIDQLTSVITNKSLPVHLVISMREDFALELNAFKPKLPTILFENFYRLEKLGRRAVSDAIVIPVEQRGFVYEPELLKRLLNDLLSRELDRQPNSPVIEMLETVEPPYLQIVCARLWELNKGDADKTLRLASYEKAGRAQGILKNYLDGVLQRFSFAEKQLASQAFDHLVSNRGVKMAYTAKALAETVRVDEEALAGVLKRLEGVRVLREMPRKDELWYELYHDMFSGSIEDWNNAWKDRMRRRRAAKIAGGVVFGIGVIVAGWDYYVNFSNYHFRLSPKQGLSDQVEVWLGKPDSIDLFKQHKYLSEADFGRFQLEPDKQFNEKLIEEYSQLQKELSDNLSIEKRMMSYAKSGDYSLALKLGRDSVVSYDPELAGKMLAALAEIPVPGSPRIMYQSLVSSESATIKRKILGDVNSRLLGFSSGVILANERGSVKNSMVTEELELWKSVFSTQIAHRQARESIIDMRGDENFIELLTNVIIFPETIPYIKSRLLAEDSSIESPPGLVGGLSKIMLKDVTPMIIKLLENKKRGVRSSAASVLGKIGARNAIPSLIALLNDEDEVVRSSAITSLEELGAITAISDLIKLLNDKQSEVRSRVATALSNLSAREAIPSLTQLLNDKNKEVRVSSVVALGGLGAEDAIPDLIKLLADEDSAVRAVSATALARLNAKRAIPQLIKSLNDDNNTVRSMAAEALGDLRARSAIPVLLSMLHELEINHSIVSALKKIEGKEDVLPVSYSSGKDDGFHERAFSSLNELEMSEVMPALVNFIEKSNEFSFVDAISILKRFDFNKRKRILMTSLNDKQSKVRHLAVFSLGEFEYYEAKALILKLLNDNDADVRSSSISTLVKLRIENAEGYFLPLLDDESQLVKKSAIFAVKKLKIRQSIPKLINLLKSESVDVRSSAISALSVLQAKEAVPYFVMLLNDKSPVVNEVLSWLDLNRRDVRSYSSIALGNLKVKEAIPGIIDLLQYKGGVNFSAVKALSEYEDLYSFPYFIPTLNDKKYIFGHVKREHPNLNAFSSIASKELVEFLIRSIHKNIKQEEKIPFVVAAFNMLRNDHLNQIQKSLLRKALTQVKQVTLNVAQKYLVERDEKEVKEKTNILTFPVNQPGLEGEPLTLKQLKLKLDEMNRDYMNWRTVRDSEEATADSSSGVAENNALENPAPFIYEYAYAIAHESEKDGIELLGHNLYKVREAAARGLANSDALGVDLLKKLEKAWLETTDPIERQGIYHAIDIALLAIEGVGYEKELADLKTYEPTLTNERSAASIKPRVEWTRIQLQWRVDANKELQELAARQLPKLLKEYCLNEDGTDIPEEECTIGN